MLKVVKYRNFKFLGACGRRCSDLFGKLKFVILKLQFCRIFGKWKLLFLGVLHKRVTPSRPVDWKMADGVLSFWGPVTSTHEWCEPNYVYSSYIAEFFNTISIAPGILLALIGLVNALRQRFEKRFSVLHISNMILAIGSMLYHATLQRLQQQGDETPMVWEMLLYIYVLYSPDWHYRSTMPTFLCLYGAAFAVAHSLLRFHIGFKAHYVLLCLLCIPRMYKYYILTEDTSAKRLAKLYVVTLSVGSLFWLNDRLFCKDISRWYFNPQGHAVWHICMGFNS